MLRALFTTCFLTVAAAGCATPQPTASFPIGRFQAWSDQDAPFRLYPGDTVTIDVPSAPELSSALEVGPDGRISVPLGGRVMIADMTVDEAEAALESALASQLREPDIEVRPTGYGSRQVFIGGEVEQPGIYDLPGDIGALEAVLMAGGFKDTARRRAVVVVRRTLDGGAMMRVADIQSGLNDPVLTDRMPLKRFDVVFVPRSTIAEVDLFMKQYVRDALPVNFGLYYDLRDN